MDQSIFYSAFSLEFKNSFLEAKYQSEQKTKRINYNYHFTCLLFFLSLVNILILTGVEEAKEIMVKIFYLSLPIYFLLIKYIVSNYKKADALNEIIHLINRNLFTLLMISIRTEIKSHTICPSFLPAIYTFEVVSLILMTALGMSDFHRELKLWLINSSVILFKLYKSEIVFYLVFFLLVSLLNFNFTNSKKNCYFFKERMKEEKVWYMNVLENINTGFIQVTDQGIIMYSNKTMKDNFKKLRTQFKEESEKCIENINNSECNNQKNIKILEEILKNLLAFKNGNNYLKGTFLPMVSPFKFLFSILSQHENEFLFLGAKSFIVGKNEEDLTFEISCRLVKIKSNTEVLEFLFNDITKIKYIENQMADQKYRALIHSKLAHEFKNPLISINELADQVADFIFAEPFSEGENFQRVNKKFYSACFNNSYKNKKAINQILPQIKAMSNYLLLIIKDFSYFSKKDSSQLKANLAECKLDEILHLCEEIALGLLKKLGKCKNVSFKIKKEFNIPDTIVTDEIKLKQVLINLISNAVKFTNRGKIKLELKFGKEQNLDKQVIVFSVSDTGVGIPHKKNLFCDDFNSIGMSIIKAFTKIIGEEIKYTSEQNKGSNFWFSIPITSVELDVGEKDYFLFNPSKKRKSRSELSFTTENNNVADSTCRPSSSNNRSFMGPSKRMNFFNMKKKNNSKSEVNINRSLDFLNSSTETVVLNDLVLTNPFQFTESDIENDLLATYKNTNTHFNPDDNYDPEAINIIISDDEQFIRSSTRRVLEQISTGLNLKVNFIETEDGVETIFCVYKYISQGRKISCIFSDENMIYMRGTQSATILSNLLKNKNLAEIPFYLITSYEDDLTLNNLNNNSISKIYPKPLQRTIVEQILSKLKNK